MDKSQLQQTLDNIADIIRHDGFKHLPEQLTVKMYRFVFNTFNVTLQYTTTEVVVFKSFVDVDKPYLFTPKEYHTGLWEKKLSEVAWEAQREHESKRKLLFEAIDDASYWE